MRMSFAVCAVLGVVSLPAGADSALERAAMDAVAYGLRDPGSARFRNIRTVTYPTPAGRVASYVCGEVNGKNVYGGYVGFRRFYVGEMKGQLVADIEPPASEDRSVFVMLYDTFCRGA